jgi:hypothetical protein
VNSDEKFAEGIKNRQFNSTSPLPNMQSSTLVRIYRALPADYRLLVRKWVASPVHNTREDVLRLLQYLEKHFESTKPGALNREAAWQFASASQPYQEAQMLRLMSMLTQCIRECMAWKIWQADKVDGKLKYLHCCKKISLEKEEKDTLTEIAEALQRSPLRDTKYHLQLLDYQGEQAEFEARSNRSAGNPIADMNRTVTQATTLQLLRNACTLQNSLNLFAKEERTPLSLRYVEQITEQDLEGQPTVQLYYYLWKALKTPDEVPYFEQAKAHIYQYADLFGETERREIYLAAINYCIRRVNQGQATYLREAYQFFRKGLETRALFENGQLSIFTFKNAVSAGLGVQEFDWVRSIIEEYKAYLPARSRADAYHFNLAAYYFRLPDFEKCMELLRSTEFHDPLTNLNARAMLLRIYVEKQYLDATASLLESFQIYIKRQKNIGYQAENYLNLIRFTRQLIRIAPGDTASLARLHSEIGQTQAVAEKRWLLGLTGG